MLAADDLALAFRLADAADFVSRPHFRSEALRTTTKDDGTPVSEVDLAVEESMLALVRARGNDSVLGEEVGEQPGVTNRRWIFDGVDGTHNYADGRPGWGTIIALEIDGTVELGMVSAPLWGHRYWATRGGGAWTSSYGDGGSFDSSVAQSMRCGSQMSLADASIIVIPWEGALLGWRNTVPRLFHLPETPRSQCFALDAVMVAEGLLDVSVIVLGGIWDFAATSLIIHEAGGVFRDAWGGERLDTSSGVYTNAALIDAVLAKVAEVRPPAPDRAKLAKTESTAIGTPEEQAIDGWRAYGIRRLATMSARERIVEAPSPILAIVDERAAHLERPLLGVTNDGTVRGGLRTMGDRKVDTRPIADAASAFLQALTTEQRARATFPMDAEEWRMWINVHMNHFRHGVMLEDLTQPVRDLALEIVKATLSARGYHYARSIMQINELIAELSGDFEAFGEWPYFMSIFGSPESGEPWGWQFDGHHVCINTVVFEGRIVMTPAFLGAEPRRIGLGPLAGLSLFDPEEQLGLDLIRSLTVPQRERTIIHPSLHPDEISPSLQNLFDGRMQAGAFHDNLVAPHQGVPGTDMTDAQRHVLLSLMNTYVDWAGNGHADVRREEVVAHLDETWFSWYGGFDDHAPFYYRVHSPVILIEFDHHPGVVFDNEVPSRHHVHTVVRTPNGGDYGADLLRQHHEQFDHSAGHHEARH